MKNSDPGFKASPFKSRFKGPRLKDQRRPRNSGVILILGCCALPLIMGMLGLAVDLSVMYSIKARLQMADDGAALAALRSISLGNTVSAQATTATNVATNWFHANYANGFLGSTNTSAPPTVSVTQDNVNYVTRVSVVAHTDAPTYFMKYFRFGATTLTATSEASRRNVVITLVLDRSYSMVDGTPYSGLTPCDVMKNAAKEFTGMFVPTRDYIGLVSFAQTGRIDASPSTNFQTTLGYQNASGSSNGAIDDIDCNGYTNTSTGILLGWNENYKIALPGALNVLVLMTDGIPTAASFRFVTTAGTTADADPSHVGKSALNTSSTCLDSTGKALNATPLANRGNMATYPRNWVGAREGTLSGGSYQVSLGSGSYWSAFSGPIGSMRTSGGNLDGVDLFFSPPGVTNESTSDNYTVNKTTEAPNCGFAYTNSYQNDPTHEVSFIPPSDIFGMLSTGYNSVTTANVLSDGFQRITLNAANLLSAITNLGDNAATFVRTAHTLPGGVIAYPATQIYVVGLGGNGGVDHTFLQRIANDPDAAPDGTSYPACTICTTARGPIGQYVYSADSSQLETAFATIASQILRISK